MVDYKEEYDKIARRIEKEINVKVIIKKEEFCYKVDIGTYAQIIARTEQEVWHNLGAFWLGLSTARSIIRKALG